MVFNSLTGVIFVRTPGSGGYLNSRTKVFPRARTWALLLAKTGARRAFPDHPELQGYGRRNGRSCPRDAVRFTEALYAIIGRDVKHRVSVGGGQKH